jgi:hypothetical protein
MREDTTLNMSIFFQLSTYISFATSSLLIVLCVYVFHLLQSSARSKAPKEAWQNCYLEQREDYSSLCDRNGHMNNGHRIPINGGYLLQIVG